MPNLLDSDFNDIIEAHTESLMTNDDDISYRVAKDRVKSTYLSNRYFDDEESLFDDYE